MYSVVVVFMGGGLGAVARYLCNQYFRMDGFPLGTLAANILACFFLGFVLNVLGKQEPGNQQLFFATGFCGGFSTFSTFGQEIFEMGQGQLFAQAAFYAAISLLLGLIAIYLGGLLASFFQ